ncbi:MAG: 4-alpha-glucanotransferase, partial [Acidimicrobiia bacterium]
MTESRAPTSSRNGGLLLHLTSLPGRFGIGDLGPEAHRFVARIAGAGQKHWQMLPVGPTGYGNSPYSALSTFAGNTLLISPELLVREGLMNDDDLAPLESESQGRVDFGRVFTAKLEALRAVGARFLAVGSRERQQRLHEFEEREGPIWLDEYCLFVALKDAHDGKPWTDWDAGLVAREPTALAAAQEELGEAIELNRVLQFLFFEQWQALRLATREQGIEIVGDLPLYVAHDSADVWANRSQFLLDATGRPTVVAGVPPDYFSATGQRWGNPIFNWDLMAEDGFRWWRARMRQAVSRFDTVRIDHFRGIAGYWEIPAAERTAENGRWCPGPGAALFEAIREDLGEIPVIAEDLGVITDDVIALREH